MKFRIVHIHALFCTVLSLVFWSAPVRTLAQEPAGQPENPVAEAIERSSDGSISVTIPEDMLRLILNGAPRHASSGPARPTRPSRHIGKAEGWRVQVFADGQHPSTLSARARARGKAIVARFPKYRGQVYTFSSSPNWYCRVGNFRTAAEANAALAELKRAFPAFASEMRTVKSTVILR